MRANITFEPAFDELYESFLGRDNGRELLTFCGVAPHQIDVGAMSHKYFTDKVQDMSVDANANANGVKSVNSYQAEIMKGILKLEGFYLLWRYIVKRYGEKRANELLVKIWEGRLYFHDASGANIQIPYCFAYSTTPLMVEGRPYGQLHSLPPKRSDSFIAQVTECTMDMSQDFAGAVAPADLLVNYSYYAKKENLNDKDILNDLQKFVHVMNNGFRVGGQSPFVNISLFDKSNLNKVFGELIYADGSSPDFDYIMKVQKLFGEWFAKGDPATGLPYRFPVVTMNIYKDENGDIVDTDFLEWVSKTNINTGCFNIYVNDGYKVATCCRLVNDRSKAKVDSFGNGGMNIGSHRVVTINLPAVAYESAGNVDTMMVKLDEMLFACKDLLIVHRDEILRRRVRDGICKFFSPLKWFDIDDLFSTVGLVGIYEMTDIMGFDILSEEGQQFVLKVVEHIERRMQEFSDETGKSFNCEEIPAEQAGVNLCEMDKLRGFDGGYELYSNQYIPLITEADLLTRIEVTGKFQSLLSGGGILHINVDSKLMSETQMESIIKTAVKNGVQHFAINYGYGVCENGHTSIVGNGTVCPKCNGRITDYLTRVVGYFTKVSTWNKKRRNFEYPNRKFISGGKAHG